MNNSNKCGPMPETLWTPGDIVTRDGTDEHVIISINADRDLLEVECVKEPLPYSDGAAPWTRIGERESNLTRRYSFVRTGMPNTAYEPTRRKTLNENQT